MQEGDQSIEFGRFRMIPAQRLLLNDGEPVPLGGRAYDLLLTLVERCPEIISKDDLLQRVWGSQHVGDNTLAVHLSALRKALGDATDKPRYIATVPRRGYRFLPTPATPRAADEAGPRPARALPHAIWPLIGRDAVLDRLLDQISASFLVTLTGPGGIGKTRLAVAAAQRMAGGFPDGAWWIDLAPVQDPGLMAATVAHRLGLSLGGGPVVPQLVAYLRQRRALLILDNCEHVVAEAAIVATALRGCAGLRLLATSLEPLAIAGEHVERLEPLGMPDAAATPAEALRSPAVQLFVDRARARASDFVLDGENVGAVASLCRRLEGVPLALELAAARAALLGAEPVARRLDRQLIELSSDRRDDLPKHQTLRALLAWSYGLLAGAEQVALRRMAVFAGGCTLEAAEAVIADQAVPEWLVAELISSLIAKSLVVARQTPEGARYRLLDTTRIFAHERLIESGEMPSVMRRAADHLSRLFEAADPALDQSSEQDWAARCMPELDNLRATLDWCFADPATAALGVILTGFSLELMKKLGDEGRRRIETAFALLDGSTPDEIASALWLGRQWMAVLENDFDAATEAAERSLAYARASGKPLRVLRAGIVVARARALSEQWHAASGLLEELKQICEAGRFRVAAINTEAELAQVYILEGRLADAIRSLDHAQDLNARRNDPLTGAFIAADYALYHAIRGEFDPAAEKMLQGWRLADEAAETDLATICRSLAIALSVVGRNQGRAAQLLTGADLEPLIVNTHISRQICFLALAVACGEAETTARIWGTMLVHAKMMETRKHISSILFAELTARLPGRADAAFSAAMTEGENLGDREREAVFRTAAALYLRMAARGPGFTDAARAPTP